MADNCFNNTPGECAHAEGRFTTASGPASHSEGQATVASETASHAEGINTNSAANGSHSEGEGTNANAEASHAEGLITTADGEASHTEGQGTRALGANAHAEGDTTTAEGIGAHSEGHNTIAFERYSHAEGSDTRADGFASHAEGSNTHTTAAFSHAEGANTQAIETAAHAEGSSTIASGIAAHAEGVATIASGINSHAEGAVTSTSNTSNVPQAGAHIMGKFGNACAAYSWFMANGTNDANRSISAWILNSGDACFNTVSTASPCPCPDFAEMFEAVDGQPIEPGYFVTLDGKKIRKANSEDDFILGIVSATSAMILGTAELNWHKKYLTDEWGNQLFQEVTLPPVLNQHGKEVIPERTETQPVLNPEWDNSIEYVPRRERPEWASVGLVGQLLVRDDGSCQVNGYCRPNDEGIASTAERGYRVLERVGPSQILVFFK